MPVKPKPKVVVAKDVIRFGIDLAVLKARAGRLGLWRTVHAIDEATKTYILDVLEIPEKGLRPKPAKRRT